MSECSDMWFIILFVSVCTLVQGQFRVDPLVSTKAGLIRGLQSDQGYAKFLGVPYAVLDQENLFGPSLAHPGFDDIFEANESNVCPQVASDQAIGSLDCLTLNIYVPNTANTRNRLPVMAWIHGGAFAIGSSISEGTPDFLLKNDVIVVGINYRLGIYGFMCLDIPEVSGNQGLKDQVLALRWINENIEAFGGDARQITVFGESAGGISVNLHLLSPYENLFQRAIIQSGPALNPWTVMESNSTIPLQLAAALDFETEDVIEALKFLATVDALTLAKLASDLKIAHFSGTELPVVFPCIEKEFEGVEGFITDHPNNLEPTKVKNIPVIIGINNNEMPFMYGNADADFFSNYDFDLISLVFDLGDNLEEAVDDVRHFYIGDEEPSIDVEDEITDFASDFVFNYPTQRVAERFLDFGAKAVFRYVFSYSGDRNLLKIKYDLNSSGAIHADELGYLFENESFTEETTPEDQLTIDRITTLWTNFAKYGDPTPQTSDLLPVKWEPITKTSQPYLSIDSDLTLEGRPFYDRMAFWDVFFRLHKDHERSSQNFKK